MPILADDLWKSMRASLGVMGTQRYLPEPNIIPSINDGLRQFNAFVYSLTANGKGSEELMREITMTRVFQTNDMGGVVLNEAQLGHKVWTVNAVYPRPVIEPADALIQPIPLNESAYRPDVRMRRPGPYRCARITVEQVPDSESSRSMPGSEKLAGTMMQNYAYYIVGDRSGTDYDSGVEVVVLPASVTPTTFVAISYMKGVDPITTLDDTIPYPASAFPLLQSLSLNAISIRQGAEPMFVVTRENVAALLRGQT